MEKIGFIGLGIMGKPMALNLLKAGYEVVAHNRSKASVEELAVNGAIPAFTPKEVAQKSDMVITMLPDSEDVEKVCLLENGVIEGLSQDMLFIDMSTIAPQMAQKVHAEFALKGVKALDAPVSGGDVGAKAGTLSIMVGGDEEAFKRALPLFEIMGRNIVHMGDAGAGQVTKACNQIVVGVTILGVSEALTLARKSGVDPAKVREALLGGFAQSRILDLHGKRNLDRNFEPGFKVALHRKDMNIVNQAGKAQGVPLMASALTGELMDALIAQGKGDLDHSAMALLLEQLSGIKE